MATKAERIVELLNIISNKSERIKKLKLECGQQSTQICVLNLRIKELEKALESIWPFIEEDFPKGTGNNHGTCASDLYVLAARQVDQALKG